MARLPTTHIGLGISGSKLGRRDVPPALGLHRALVALEPSPGLVRGTARRTSKIKRVTTLIDRPGLAEPTGSGQNRVAPSRSRFVRFALLSSYDRRRR